MDIELRPCEGVIMVAMIVGNQYNVERFISGPRLPEIHKLRGFIRLSKEVCNLPFDQQAKWH